VVAELACQLGYPTTTVEARARLARVIGRDEDAVFVACLADGSAVGWIHVLTVYRVESNLFAELGGLVVSEHHRRLGVGRLLVAEAERWAARRGLTTIRVRTRTERTDTHVFYESLGFERTKTQHVFDRPLEQD
jgi:GNAT superfamily N-acetyltransferase